MRGLAALALVMILVLIAAGSALYYDSITGFMLGGESNTPQNNTSGLVIGAPVPDQPWSSGQIGITSPPGNQTGTLAGNSSASQGNRTIQTTQTANQGGGGGGSSGSSGSSGGGCTPGKSYGGWSACSNGTQGRAWSDGCGASGTEYQDCSDETAAPDIFVSPPTLNVSNGSAFSLNVSVNVSFGVYAAEFSVVYNSSLLDCTGLSDGLFLKSDGASAYTIKDASQPGVVSFASTRMGTTGSVSGYGNLLQATFTAKSAGTSAIGIENVTLADSTPAVIENVTHGDGAVVVY